MNEKEQYKEICEVDNDIPLYLQPWWLDIVSGPNNWDVILSLNQDQQFQGSLIYHKVKKWGMQQFKNPPFSAYSGIWLKYPKNLKLHSLYAFEKKTIHDLISQLPTFHFFSVLLYPDYKNGLPFIWKKFSATVRYTYILHLNDLRIIESNLKGSTRTAIKTAKQHLTISEHYDIEQFIKLLELSYRDKKQQVPYTLDKLRILDKHCATKNIRKLLFAKDKSGQIHGGIYLLKDRDTVHYFMGFRNPEIDQYNAISLLLWEAIKNNINTYKLFNFEGSMNAGIEHFFRSYGAALTPYLKIEKYKNKYFNILSLIFNKTSL